MPRLGQQALTALAISFLALGCGKKAADSSSTDSSDRSGTSMAAPGDSAAGGPAGFSPSNRASTPLTITDVQRWERGMEGELEAVQAAAAKMHSARSGEDSLNAMMGVQEMSTLSAGAQAAGVDEERYKFIRSNLSAAVSYLTPPELEGMDTTKMPQNLRDEFRNGRDASLKQMSPAVPTEVVDALRSRAAELRKKDMELAGARLKGAGA
jgi:hypothetical protein